MARSWDAAPITWIKGGPGESCTAACDATTYGTCDPPSIKSVTNRDVLGEVAAATGHTCQAEAPWNNDPAYRGMVWWGYDFGPSTCTDNSCCGDHDPKNGLGDCVNVCTPFKHWADPPLEDDEVCGFTTWYSFQRFCPCIEAIDSFALDSTPCEGEMATWGAPDATFRTDQIDTDFTTSGRIIGGVQFASNFATRWTGEFRASATGNATFLLECQHNARLYIDGLRVVQQTHRAMPWEGMPCQGSHAHYSHYAC